MENTDILKAEIKSILAVKAKEGATYQDIKGKFERKRIKILENVY